MLRGIFIKMVKVKLVVIGGISKELNLKRVLEWKSGMFSICQDIVRFNLNSYPDLPHRGFSDNNLEHCLPTMEQINKNSDNNEDWNITFYVMSIPLEDNYYSRTLNNNRIVVTYNEVKNHLRDKNIPLENYLLRLIYAYTLIYMAKKEKELSMRDEDYFSHEDSRGCLFDMCGTYQDFDYSSISPTICEECSHKIVQRNIPNGTIQQLRKELKGLRQTWNHRLNLWLQTHPIISIVISVFSSITLTIIGNYIWKWLN